MKRIIFIILLLSPTCSLFSQALFNRIYRFDSAQYLATTFFSMGIANNKVYLAGFGNVPFDSRTFITHGLLSQVDITTGNIIKNNYYGKQYESTYYRDNVMFVDKNSINLIGSNFDSSITFIKASFDGEVLIRKKYYPTTFPTTYYGNTASITKFGSGYVFTTFNAFFTRTPTKASVVIIDTLGNITKTFDFDADSLNCGPGAIMVNKNKNLTFSTIQTKGNDTDSGFVYVSKIREIDSVGRTLWSYSTPANRYIFADKFVQLANGNYLMWGTEELARIEFNGNYWLRQTYGVGPYLAEINPQRGLVWEKRYQVVSGGRLHGLKILRDSSIVLTGRYADGPYSTSGFLIRLNSRKDSVYRRSFRTPQFATDRVVYYPNQIEELPNGDLLIGGYILNNRLVTEPGVGQWGLLIRTDSLGCSLEPSSCRVATKEVENEPLSIKVFPNPVSSELNIDYTPDNANGKLEIKLFDIVGKTVFNKKMDAFKDPLSINVSNLAEGIYIVSITVQGKKTYTAKFIKQ